MQQESPHWTVREDVKAQGGPIEEHDLQRELRHQAVHFWGIHKCSTGSGGARENHFAGPMRLGLRIQEDPAELSARAVCLRAEEAGDAWPLLQEPRQHCPQLPAPDHLFPAQPAHQHADRTLSQTGSTSVSLGPSTSQSPLSATKEPCHSWGAASPQQPQEFDF